MNKKQEKVPVSDAKIIIDGEDGTKLYKSFVHLKSKSATFYINLNGK